MLFHLIAANVHALPKCRNRIPTARPRRNFFLYGAALKLNRIPKVESICSVAGISAMQCYTPQTVFLMKIYCDRLFFGSVIS